MKLSEPMAARCPTMSLMIFMHLLYQTQTQMMLPWEYGVRNLARRPVRTALTLVALATVVMLVFVVVGFIRGLELSLAISGDRDVALVYSVNSEENIENSSIEARTPDLLTASIEGVWNRFGVPHVSPELYMGTRVRLRDGSTGLGLVRGVTRNAPLVRRSVRLTSGHWPQAHEVMVGRLAAAKLGINNNELAIGQTIEFEGQSWTISGEFSAGGGCVRIRDMVSLNGFPDRHQTTGPQPGCDSAHVWSDASRSVAVL